MVWFLCLIWFHINIYGLVNDKAILVEEQWYYLTHSWRGFISFQRVLVPKWMQQHPWSLNLLTLRPQSNTLVITSQELLLTKFSFQFLFYIWTEGAPGVMVIVIRNGQGDKSKSWMRLIPFHMALIPLRKGMNSIILPLAMGK